MITRADDDGREVARQHHERHVRDLVDVGRDLNQLVAIEHVGQAAAEDRAGAGARPGR